jgi:predicted enzyme related to lactoylglutathione lyase
MPHIEKPVPGSFCWIELSTTDQNGAKSFYNSLLQWTAVDQPMGPGEFYTMFQIEGKNASAAYTMRPEERVHGAPPHWKLYIAVENADTAATRAAELGGKVLVAPFDVMDAGRMAIIQDPGGAIFCVWQANQHQGLEITGVDGALCWADLNVPEPTAVETFYAGLFGWRLEVSTSDSSGYLHIKNGDEFIGGIPPVKDQGRKIPPHWLVYFQVSDVDAAAGKAQSLGAQFHVLPMTIEKVGRFAIMADPQGAVSSIFTPAPRS